MNDEKLEKDSERGVENLKAELLDAAEDGARELIKVLKEGIIMNDEKDLSADRLKNAAQAKRIAFDDAIYILSRVAEERELDKHAGTGRKTGGGFAENRAT